MAVNRLKATICGTTYTLVSEESLSYMRDVAARVDEDMAAILDNDRHMSTTMAAVLMAVQYADKAIKEEKAADDLRVQYKKLLDASETLQDELASLKAETARLKEEALQLRQAAAPKAPPTPAPPVPPVAPVAKPMVSFEEILDEEEL